MRDQVTAGEMRAMLREHALIAAPGEILVVQVPPDWSPSVVRDLQDALRAGCDVIGADLRVLVVPGTAVTVAQMPSDPLPDL